MRSLCVMLCSFAALNVAVPTTPLTDAACDAVFAKCDAVKAGKSETCTDGCKAACKKVKSCSAKAKKEKPSTEKKWDKVQKTCCSSGAVSMPSMVFALLAMLCIMWV